MKAFELNATLIIQICNFGLAYLVLRVLLLRPVYQHIVKDEAKEAGLLQSMTELRDQIDTYKAMQEAAWQRVRSHFEKHKPETMLEDSVKTVLNVASLAYPELSHKERIQLISQLSSAMVRSIDTERK